jgi:uridylate kinase
MSKTRFKRVLLKIGGESLLGNREYGIDPQAALDLANHIKQIYALNVEVAIVIGGGNIFRGLAGAANGIERATADYMGMMATVMNGLALHDALEKVNVPVRIQSALQMPAVAESFVRRKAIRHMEKGRVVILGAGTGVPYVTTDTGASLHGLELRCDVLMKATKVNGVYEKDPEKFPNARRYRDLDIKQAIEDDDIQVMDTSALAMCKENGLPIMVFELFKGDNLSKAVLGEDIGTYISGDVKTSLV